MTVMSVEMSTFAAAFRVTDGRKIGELPVMLRLERYSNIHNLKI
jgi:hypothetical protein